MIWKIASAVAGMAALAGCASAPPTADASRQMAHAFESRIVSCVLPYLYDPDARVLITYGYRNGAATFVLKPQNDDLQARVVECASPESGPLAQFSGEVEIWGKR